MVPGRPRENKRAFRATVNAGDSRGNSGFSHIELIVSISVVLVLVAILIPVSQQILMKSEAVKCVSNLRQWGTMFSLYIAENNGTFPLSEPFKDGKSWQWPTAPLSEAIAAETGLAKWRLGEGIIGCPAHDNSPVGLSYTERYYSYVYNYHLGIEDASGQAIRFSSVERPSQIIMIADATNARRVSGFSKNYGQENNIGYVHGGKYNALYVDGHVDSSDTISKEENIYP